MTQRRTVLPLVHLPLGRVHSRVSQSRHLLDRLVRSPASQFHLRLALVARQRVVLVEHALVATAAARRVAVAEETALVAALDPFLVLAALLAAAEAVLVAGVLAVQPDVARQSDGASVVATAKNFSQ